MHSIRLLKEHQVQSAVNTLSSAFQEDPLYRFIIPDARVRSTFLQLFFAFRVRYGMKFGEVQCTSEHCEGVAIWIPFQSVKMTYPRIIRGGGLSVLRAVDAGIRKKLFELQEFAEDARERISGPYWHLAPIAVHPAHQVQGLASLLIRSMLARLDREQSACTLETQNSRNVVLYERYGFKTVSEGLMPGSDVHHWLMLRDVQPLR
jgi:GNAT superfamily N-acetyltransferase